MKAASQGTKLSDNKLIFFVTSYQHFKTQAFGNHRPFLIWFYFYYYFNRQFSFAIPFYVQNRKICLSKNIFYQYFVGFLLCLGHLL